MQTPGAAQTHRFRDPTEGTAGHDGALLRELRGHPAGNTMIVGVVDAAMRALPEPLAFGVTGRIANTLLASRPQTWRAGWWTPLAPPLACWWWRRRKDVFLRRAGR
jgi:hypothetical protein